MIDFRSLETRLVQDQIPVMDRWKNAGVTEAKRHAPVRKIFAGQSNRERIRAKSIEEISADRELRARAGLGPEYGPLNTKGVNPATILTQYALQELSQRRVTPGSDPYTGRKVRRQLVIPSAQARLDRRGVYELKVGRAITERENLGGGLRDAIYADETTVDGYKVHSRIVSPKDYSIYNELGTRHMPAHPFLRPAGAITAPRARVDAGRTMAGTLRSGLRAVVPVKARMVTRGV